MNATYLFIDDEMGGLDKDKHSLLQVYLMAVDANFKIVDDLNLLTKPDDGNYCVCAEAMNVNKIDLVKHDALAITYKEASTKLYKWLQLLTDDGKIKLVVVGHGVYGDVEWIIKYLLSRGSWEKFTSYRKLDTSAAVQFLKACDIFTDEVSGSLESLSKYFGIPFDENKAHNAKYDTEKTYEVFLALRKMMANQWSGVK
jgi:oligoribonuclease (3'-5' exoribonuclease)